jgi:hypothetical protein
MVKVILFHLFHGQQVVGIDEEPLAISHASTTILAATKAGTTSPRPYHTNRFCRASAPRRMRA